MKNIKHERIKKSIITKHKQKKNIDPLARDFIIWTVFAIAGGTIILK